MAVCELCGGFGKIEPKHELPGGEVLVQPGFVKECFACDGTGEVLEIVLSDEVKADMKADPDIAAAIGGLMEAMRQADHGVRSGKYASIDDALEAITGNRPEVVYEDEE
jgi:hypothetical protein